MVGSSGQSRLALLPSLPTHPQVAAYAGWDSSVRSAKPSRLALLNLAVRNISSTPAEQKAAAVTLDISQWVGKHTGSADASSRNIKVKRMTAPGLDSKNSSTATWAGQSYENGTARGEEVVEELEGTTITLQGSETALLFF